MRDWVRRGGVLLLALGLLVGVALGVAWGLFHFHGPELVRSKVEAALAAATGRPAHVGAAAFRPWLASLRLSDVRVGDEGPAAGGTRVRIEHADVGIRLESLWRRQLVLSVSLIGLDVTTAGGGGGGDLATLSLPATVWLGFAAVRVGRIRLERSQLVHRDRDGGATIEIRGIEADGWPEPPGLRVAARAESLRYAWPTGEERVEQLRLEGRIQPGEIQLRPSRLSWQGREVRLSGRLAQPAAGAELETTLQGRLPLEAR